MIRTLSRFAAQWRIQRLRHQAELALGSLTAELRRDIGFPAVELFLDGKARFPRR